MLAATEILFGPFGRLGELIDQHRIPPGAQEREESQAKHQCNTLWTKYEGVSTYALNAPEPPKKIEIERL